VRRALVLAVALVAVLAASVPAGAAAAAPARTSFNDVEDEVMCDTCNVPLNIAESDRADQERAAIRRLIAQGLTKQQILAELKSTYGPGILAKPQDSGFSLAVWWVPVAVVAALLALIALLLPRWRRRRPPDDEGDDVGPDLSPAESRRLEQDLARYDV
jgi:cytochrome c-type biogenesis protein CcmH